MLRLNSRVLAKKASSTSYYICHRCREARIRPSPLRQYHETSVSLERLRRRLPPRDDRSYDTYSRRDDVESHGSAKPYGRARRYRNVEDDYPEDDFKMPDVTRFQHREDQSQPDIHAIMANARGSEFSRTLHKLRKEELDQRDPALLILKKMEKPNTFQESSLRPIMKKALQRAYPNVRAISQTQKNMLLLLQEGYSLCATGPPGSGKSFTAAVWLLQLMRSTRPTVQPNGKLQKTPTTTGIIFVPTVDLMHQYMALLGNLYNAFAEPGKPMPPKETVFQGLTRFNRGLSKEEAEQMQTLAKYPSPHIIVTTPLRFMDILNDPDTKNLVDLENLKVIIADEVDSMINQRPAPKKLDEMTDITKKRKDQKWQKPTPLETCIDFIIARREMLALDTERKHEQIQFCFISPNLSPVLKSKLTIVKGWVEASENESKANSLLNLGMQDFSELFDHEKIHPIVSLPARIKHYALSVDMSTGIMRDIPSYDQDVLIRSKDEQAEIEKYVNILKIHHDPRVESLSKQALMVEAAQEGILTEEESGLRPYQYLDKFGNQQKITIKDVITDVQNDFRNIGIPRNFVLEIMETLMKRDNYPERALMFVPPSASRQKYIDALREAGFKAELVRFDTTTEHGIQLGRSDLTAPEQQADKVRSKEDATIWVASSHHLRGIDTPHFTHAYIMVPATGYQKYNQMAGRVARYPFPKQVGQLKEPEGQVTTIYLEEPVGDFKHAPFVDGVIQIDSPVEGLAWRRIHRMYGLCGAKVDKYFGEEEGIMLRSAQDKFGMFPEMDEELPWADAAVAALSKRPDTGPVEKEVVAKPKPQETDSYEFLPLEETPVTPLEEEPVTTLETSTQEPPSPLPADEEKIEAETREDENDPRDSPSIYEPRLKKEDEIEPVSTDAAPQEPTAEEQKIESETREDENDPEDSPSIYEAVELQDGPHFAPEDSEVAAPEGNVVETEGQNLADEPVEVAEGISEAEAKEFQEAQDDIFKAFMELNILQEKMRQSKEDLEGKENPDATSTTDDKQDKS